MIKEIVSRYCFWRVILWPLSEAVVQICSVEKVFLKISQNPQEKWEPLVRESFLKNLQVWDLTIHVCLLLLHCRSDWSCGS